ncbi:MAG: ribosome biogenesis GTP-binding protein YihA/YsxC [Eubacteriales bacterium]
MNIHDARLIISAVSKRQYPDHDLSEILLLGRSNVGKSSFINTIIHRKKLARTSSYPGKTRTINFYNIQDSFCFVDMPGYGYAKVSKKERVQFKRMISEYVKERDHLLLVFQLVDFRHKPSQDDILVNQWLKDEGIIPLVVATKVDKVKRNDYQKNIRQIMTALQVSDEDIILFSSEKKYGKEEVLEIIIDALYHA